MMTIEQAQNGLYVGRGAVAGILKRAPNGWDVLTADGLVLQSIDLAEWTSREAPPPIREVRSGDGLRVGQKDQKR